jgi:hypothetical protein
MQVLRKLDRTRKLTFVVITMTVKRAFLDFFTKASNSLSLFRIGIGMLIFALLVSALMGIYQETLYGRYGKYPQEALFYSVRQNQKISLVHLIFILAYFTFTIIRIG